jgi:hypothetical protein
LPISIKAIAQVINTMGTDGEDATVGKTEKKTKEAAAPAEPPNPLSQMKMSQIAPMLCMLALQKFDLEALGYVHHVEVAYIVVQILCACALYSIYMKISQQPDGGAKIRIPAVTSMGQQVSPESEQTPKEYDMSKFKEDLKKAVMGPIILGGIYYKWRTLLPLVMQALMAPMQMYEAPLFQIYILGKKNVTRPFPAENPFGLPQTPPPPAEAVSDAPAEAPAKKEFKEGTRVRIQGLNSQKELNGKEGVLGAFHKDVDRWDVEIDSEVYRMKVSNFEPLQDKVEVKDAEEKKDD